MTMTTSPVARLWLPRLTINWALHSNEPGDSATRGGVTIWFGRGFNPAFSGSLTHVGIRTRTDADGLGDLLGDDVDHELTCGLGVLKRIPFHLLSGIAGFFRSLVGRRKHDQRRLIGDGVEVRERGRVQQTVGA